MWLVEDASGLDVRTSAVEVPAGLRVLEIGGPEGPAPRVMAGLGFVAFIDNQPAAEGGDIVQSRVLRWLAVAARRDAAYRHDISLHPPLIVSG